MTLQLLHSEFPYISGKFDFLFISVASRGGGGGAKSDDSKNGGFLSLILVLRCSYNGTYTEELFATHVIFRIILGLCKSLQ
jgi:hypothetical protein